MLFFGDKLSPPCDDADNGPRVRCGQALAWLSLNHLPQGWAGVEVARCDSLDAHHVARLQGAIAGVDAEVRLQAANAVAADVDVAGKHAGVEVAGHIHAVDGGCGHE